MEKTKRPALLRIVCHRPRVLRCARRAGERRRFLDLAAQIKHQQRRQRANYEHAAPADGGEQQAVDHRGEQIARRVAGLQQSRHQPARLGRDALDGEGSADAPFAAHGDAVDGAQDEQRAERGRKAGSEFDRRVANDVHHQRRPAAVAVGGKPEQHSLRSHLLPLEPHIGADEQQNAAGDEADDLRRLDPHTPRTSGQSGSLCCMTHGSLRAAATHSFQAGSAMTASI
jgi:hypothetical protein